MLSLNILFTGKNQIEVCSQAVRDPGPNDVIIKARKSLISTGTESICLGRLFESGTHWDSWVTYPFSPGYSLVGEVVEVGSAVKGFRQGDRVTARLPHRQYVVASANELFPVPDGVSDDEATFAVIAQVVENGVRRAEHVLGEATVVIGLGLLGQLVVQYARLLGAREVIAIDTAARRLEMAKAHGATITLAKGAEEARPEVLKLTDGVGAEIVYDMTGSAVVFPCALRLLRRFGRLILIGDTGSPAAQHLTPDVITKGLRIIGAHGSNPPLISTEHAYWSLGQMTRLFFTYLQRGDMRVSDLITHRYAPSQATQAYQMLCENRSAAMGVIFDWTGV